MILTETNLMEFAASATPGTKFYAVEGDDIRGYRFIATYENHKGFYAFSDANVSKAMLFSVYSIARCKHFTEYDEAKKALLDYVIKRVESVKDIYFKEESAS